MVRKYSQLGGVGLVMLAAACSSAERPVERTGTTSSRLAIQKVEVNQALGVQYKGAQKFVAGKNTAVLVYLDEAVTPDAATHKVEVKLGSTAVVTLTPKPSSAPTKVLVFECDTREACGSWAEGDYTFDANIGGVTQQATAKFQKRRGLKILAVPIKARYGNDIKEIADPKWKKSVDFVRATFPVAPEDIKWVVRDTLDLTQHDIMTDPGRLAVWQALTDLNPAVCASNKQAEGCYDVVSGFVKERMGSLQGYTYALPGVVSVNDDEDLPATVAHEISHPFGIGDEYKGGQFNCDVNPVPKDYVGKNFNPPNEDNWSCTNSTEIGWETLGVDQGTGTLVKADEWHPFDTTGRGILGNVAGYMGSGSKQEVYWVTPRIYDRLFDQLAPTAQLTPAAVVPVIGIEAFISKSGNSYTIDAQPMYTFDAPSPAVPATTGTFWVKAVDAQGNELSKANAPVTFSPAYEPPSPVNETEFSAELALPTGAKKIQFMHLTNVLHEIEISANKPVVTLAGVTAGQTVAGKTKVTWTMSDADGDELKANLEYSGDNGARWDVLGEDLTGTELEINWDELPGAGTATSMVRLVVTDGVNTSIATSPAFIVAAKKPEVYIDGPESAAEFLQGQEVLFDGGAFDEQDGDLTSAQALEWTSDKDGKIGVGAIVRTDKLSVGTHTVTLKATNSVKASEVATVTVTVKPRPDVDGGPGPGPDGGPKPEGGPGPGPDGGPGPGPGPDGGPVPPVGDGGTTPDTGTAPKPASSDSGCSVSTSGSSNGGSSALVLAAAAFALACSRRRSRK